MQRSFVIKVSDLLKTPGGKDEIEFEGLITDKLQGLTKEGIKWIVELQALNDKTIYVTLLHVAAKVNDKSDLSWKAFVREATAKDFSAKFVLEFTNQEDAQREIFDEEFPINEKSETINLEDFVVQAIQLQEPIVKLAKGEEKELENIDDMDDFDTFEEWKVSGAVTFRKG